MEGAQSSPDSISKDIKKLNSFVWELYSPERPKMDIVFFHGLLQQRDDLNDAFWKTWLVRDSKDVIWPKKWLSLKFPEARILSVKYCSIEVDAGAFVIYRLGKDLVDHIILDTSLDIGQDDRAVVFIGHSLGGAIIKQMLVSATQEQSRLKDGNDKKRIACFLHNLKGVFYYSTPKAGSKLADFMARLPKPSPMQKLLKHVADHKARITLEFGRHCRNLDVMEATVVEDLDTIYVDNTTFPARVLEASAVSGESAEHGMGISDIIRGADYITVCRAENPDSPVITKLTAFITNALNLHKSGSLLSKAEMSNSSVNTKPTEFIPNALKKHKLETSILETFKREMSNSSINIKPTEFIPNALKEHKSETSILDTFKREIEGGEDGFFVSSKWLLSLEEHESECLMMELLRAGYSETCQTSTIVLFAKSETRTSRKSTKESVRSTDIKEVGAVKVGDDLLGPSVMALKIDKNIAMAHDVGSNNPVETSSSIDHGGNLVNTSPTEWQASTLKSFEVALKNGSHSSFCVSTIWLSNVKDQEREDLVTLLTESGYEMISQTETLTWYKRIRGRAVNQAGGTSDGGSSSSSKKNLVASDKVTTSQTLAKLGSERLKLGVSPEDNTNDSSRVANAKKPNRIQDGDSTCHPQVLRVECTSSTCKIPGERSQNGDFFRQQFYDTVGKWPVAISQRISSTLEKSFAIPTLAVLDEEGTEPRQVDMNLKALATVSFSCCIEDCNDLPIIRLKFFRISAEVKHIEPDEEQCNALVLSYICTNVYSADGGGQIFLDLENECKSHPGRVLVNAPHSWLLQSGITPDDANPGSTSLDLYGDNEKRRRHDSGRPHPLLFQDTRRPVIFEGTMNSDLDLEPSSRFCIRHKLEVCFFSPSRPILEQGPVWVASIVYNQIDFDCYLEIQTESVFGGPSPKQVKL